MNSVDGHSDYGIQVYRESLKGNQLALQNDHLPRLARGGVCFEVLTVGGDFEIGAIDLRSFTTATRIIAAVTEQVSAAPGLCRLILDASDIRQCRAAAETGFILHLEGAASLADGLPLLSQYVELGVRSIGLTHNEQNKFASGCGAANDSGLSGPGQALIKEIIRQRLILDLAHLSPRSFWDITTLLEYPPIVSHANAKKICDHPRNLTDEQIRAVARNHGVIGVNFVGQFIALQTGQVSLGRLADHIEYLVNLAGIDHVGLGPDFADYYRDVMVQWIIDNHFSPDLIKYPDGIGDVTGLPLLRQHLMERGFRPPELDKIFGLNFLRVYQEIL